MITSSARSFAIALFLAQPAFAGEVNGALSSRLDFYPVHADGTVSEGRSAEVKIDAFHDFDESRIVGEFIVRGDEKDSGRRIIEARQAYLRTPLAGFDVFIGNRQEFWGKAESKNVVDVINQADAALTPMSVMNSVRVCVASTAGQFRALLSQTLASHESRFSLVILLI